MYQIEYIYLGKFLILSIIMNIMFWSKKSKRIYLDYASTTPVDPEILEKMYKLDKEYFANPSALYTEALASKEDLKESRERVANAINSQPKEIIFTSGGTESNNLALLGVFESFKKDGFIPHIITTNIEHPAILEVCKEIERRGGEVTYLKVDEQGLITESLVRDAIKENTVLVSVMYVNNEIGTVQPIKEIGRVIKEYRNKNAKSFPYFHTDACQAFYYLPVDVLKLGLDLLTLDGIKMYGPRGTGLLFVRNSLEINSIVFGGGQEGGLRSGTENTTSIYGLSLAMEKCAQIREKETERLKLIQDYAIQKIEENFPVAKLNGHREKRIANNINFCFEGQDAEFLVISLDVSGIACSYSSSCRTLKEDSSSYVVENLGRSDCSTSSLRFTFGRETTKDNIDTLITTLKKIIK